MSYSILIDPISSSFQKSKQNKPLKNLFDDTSLNNDKNNDDEMNEKEDALTNLYKKGELLISICFYISIIFLLL